MYRFVHFRPFNTQTLLKMTQMRETIHVCEFSAYTPPGGGERISAVLTYMYRFGHLLPFAHSEPIKIGANV